MTVIVDYDAGNIDSVENALSRLGAEYLLSSSAEDIRKADRVILPGVGNAARAMDDLRGKNLVEVIKGLRRPVLGICVGMQIMCTSSEEDDAACMDIFDSRVRRFSPSPEAKVPHMGWNSLENVDSKLLKGVAEGSFVYFVHSYRPDLCPDTIATCRHGEDLFSAALKYENFYGTQFHPEKSGETGELILRNFLSL